MFGYRDEELETRWYQLGTFSPINRLHSTDSPFNGKEPWNFHSPAREAMIAALRLRHRLIPYLHTMNRRAAYDGLPLVEPMYWNHGGGTVPTEFEFGTELIVSPVLEPADQAAGRAKAEVWLPVGQWFDFFDGRRYVADNPEGRTLGVWRTLDRIPVFAKAGGIIPMQRLDGAPLNDVSNPSAFDVLVFPGADGTFTLWEDDGESVGGEWASTRLTFDWARGMFTVHALDGDSSLVPSSRAWRLILRGVEQPDGDLPASVSIRHGGRPISGTVDYDPDTLSLSVEVGALNVDGDLTIHVAGGLSIAPSPVERDAFDILADAKMHYFTRERAWQSVQREAYARSPPCTRWKCRRATTGSRGGFPRICRKASSRRCQRCCCATEQRAAPSPYRYVPTQECGGRTGKETDEQDNDVAPGAGGLSCRDACDVAGGMLGRHLRDQVHDHTGERE